MANITFWNTLLQNETEVQDIRKRAQVRGPISNDLATSINSQWVQIKTRNNNQLSCCWISDEANSVWNIHQRFFDARTSKNKG